MYFSEYRMQDVKKRRKIGFRMKEIKKMKKVDRIKFTDTVRIF